MRYVPFVSIIIVNYNGKHLLKECLTSVFDISYPKEKYEVIVVDNNSSDDSVPYISSHFPHVMLIEAKENLGFTGGNALGYSYATGEYIVLLNSDTRVDSKWLKGLVDSASEKNIGMVNSKLFFSTPFLTLNLHSTIKMRSEIYSSADFSPVGILLEDVLCEDSTLDHLVWYESGFYEKGKGLIECRWTKGDATILLPYNQSNSKNTYKITVHGYPTASDMEAVFSFAIDGKEILHKSIQQNEVKQYTIEVNEALARKHFVWLVQNAGNIVLANGYGKDRGSLLYKGKDRMEEFYEHDDESFEKPTKLLACCGASCLIKREVIEKVGFFDPNYYMYYEDLDLSLRVWRAGYDIAYAPHSIVYHKHKSTTQNTSNFSFLYHVEKNHIAFVFTHFPLMTSIIQAIGLCVRFFVATVYMTIFLFSENLTAYEGWRQNFEARKKAVLFIIKHFFEILRKRISIERHSVRSFQEMSQFLY